MEPMKKNYHDPANRDLSILKQLRKQRKGSIGLLVPFGIIVTTYKSREFYFDGFYDDIDQAKDRVKVLLTRHGWPKTEFGNIDSDGYCRYRKKQCLIDVAIFRTNQENLNILVDRGLL